jgi:ABC-type transport system substrate-binding protein
MQKNIWEKGKMRDKILVITSLLVAVLMLSMATVPSLAFIYPGGAQDNYFEIFGPRIDQILIKKYAELQPEIDALKAGEIDFTDWALEKPMVDDLSTDPNIAVVGYGGEVGYYTMNFNNNNEQFLGNPPDPAYANPVYPNPMSAPALRQASSYLIDRDLLSSGPGQGMYEPIFVPVPKYMSFFTHPQISYTGLLSAIAYPPSVTDAAATLDAGGFPLTGNTGGYRYWDRNSNGVEDVGEGFTLKFYTRLDALRDGACDMLAVGYDDPLIKIKYIQTPGGGGVAWLQCMVLKDYHLYSAGWIFIGPDGDYMYDLYHWDNYYHPEDPPNYGGVSWNDAVMQTALRNLKYAPTSTAAQTAAYAFEVQFATVAAECPLASTSAPKAYNKWYTGGNDGVAKGDAEDKYRNQPWTQVVNEMGQGENAYYTFLNAYPGTYQYGDGNMIARYGWKDNTMPKTLNPMYSSWYWESEAWGKCLDGLGGRDPMTKGPVEVPSLAENWTVGTWEHPITHETLSKVTVTIRSDVKWSDGHAFDIDDVIYTFIDMPKQLRAKGCPDVWWQPTIDRVIGFYRLDPYTVDVLLDVYTYIAANWIVGNVIIPRHIWEPYIATHTSAQITGDMSGNPGMLVGTGPFIYVSNTAQTLLLVRNPTYFQTMPKCANWFEHFVTFMKKGITIEVAPPAAKLAPFIIDANKLPAKVTINVPVTNLDIDDSNDINKTVELVCPNSTVVLLADVYHLPLAPLEIHNEEFTDLTLLHRGIYTIRVTVEDASESMYEWVHANLPPDRWEMILGPRVVEKKFWVTILPDLNYDITVDIFDIVQIGTQFGGVFGSPDPVLKLLYSPLADPNQDYVVDIFDIVLVALVFGW